MMADLFLTRLESPRQLRLGLTPLEGHQPDLREFDNTQLAPVLLPLGIKF